MPTKPDSLGRRPWTMKEVRWMCANYAALGPHVCAKTLDRTPDAVILQAMHYGVGNRKVNRSEVEPRIRELHGQGMSDQEISAVLGWHRSGRDRVKYWRHLFGLPMNPIRYQEYGRRGAKAACANNDVKTLVDVRWEAERMEAARQGWIGANSLVQVRVLEELRIAPGTARQIIERQGRRFTVSQYHTMRSHLAHLIEVGLVVSRRGSQVVYSLNVSGEFESDAE